MMRQKLLQRARDEAEQEDGEFRREDLASALRDRSFTAGVKDWTP